MDPLLALVSSAHLDAVLERAGVVDQVRVRGVTVISDRSTLVSRIVRLALTYDGPAHALPVSVIVKGGLPEHSGSEWMNGQQEVAFYRDVAPSLPAGLVPRCFAAQPADAANPWYLVLEDLTDTHDVATEWPLPPNRNRGSCARGSSFT